MVAMKAKGFTLIELVLVIAILGVLAAFALPRFADLQEPAEVSVVRGVGGAFKVGIQSAHATWMARGAGGAKDNLAVFEGGTEGQLDMNSNGWPAQNYTPYEADPQLNNSADCISVWQTVLQSSSVTVSTSTSPATSDFQAQYSTAGAGTCTFFYNKRPTMSVFYNSNDGTVTTDDTP